jgi:predicted ATP-dependent serine protease
MKYKSSLNSINDWIGGYPSKVLIAFFGEATVGKTLFTLQEIYSLLNYGNALVIDSERSVQHFLEVWDAIFRKRFNVKGEVRIYEPLSLIDAFKYLGLEVNLARDENDGKVMVIYKGEKECQLEKQIVEKNIKFLLIDSITELFKEEFTGGLKNYPARSEAQTLFLVKLLKIACKHDLLVFGTHHSTMKLLQYDTPMLKGGNEIKYLFKLWFFLERTTFKKETLLGLRRLYLVRNFKHLDWSKKIMINITNSGIYPVTEAELEMMRRT